MWSSYLGSQATVVGIEKSDLSDLSILKDYEVVKGDQASHEFWVQFYKQHPDVDILIDDGGHTYLQQIQTVESAVKLNNHPMTVIVEDCETSYMNGFGPNQYTFIKWAKQSLDSLNSKHPKVSVLCDLAFQAKLRSIQFYPSLVCFKTGAPDYTKIQTLFNPGKLSNSSMASDIRVLESRKSRSALRNALSLLSSYPKLMKKTENLVFRIITIPTNIKLRRKLEKFFDR